MKEKIVELQFPLKGQDEGWARQKQPPLTTVDCLNVRPYDTSTRARGSRREGITKLLPDIGGAVPLYRQARRCADNALVAIYVAIEEIGAYPYTFLWAGDGTCYTVLSTEPAIPNPQGAIASEASRTGIADCNDGGCTDVPNPGVYIQLIRCSDDLPAQLWYAYEWAGGALADGPLYIKFLGDGQCYKVPDVLFRSESPGTLAINREDIEDCSDPGCACSGCDTFTAQVGTYAEHAWGGSLQFPHYSGRVSLCTEGHTSIVIDAESSGVAVMVGWDDAISQTYSGVKGDPVTITLPEHYIIFRNTAGYLKSQAVGTLPASVAKTFTDGTNTYALAAGSALNHGTGAVEDLEDGGFETRAWSSGVTIDELEDHGWVAADGYAHFRLVVIPSGYGEITVTAATCGGGGEDGTLFKQAKTCEDNELADVWVRADEIPSLPYIFLLNDPPGHGASPSYYIAPDAPAEETTGGGTVYDPSELTEITGCDDELAIEVNQYRKVRRCDTDAVSEYIVPAPDVTSYPFIFTKNGDYETCYQVIAADPIVPEDFGTPLSSGERTIRMDCEDEACTTPPPEDPPYGDCSSCVGTTPATILAMFSGVVICATECNWGSGLPAIQLIGSLDGVHELTQLASDPCRYEAVASITMDVYTEFSTECTGDKATHQFLIELRIDGNFAITVTNFTQPYPPARSMGAITLFQGGGIGSVCHPTPRTATNANTECRVRTFGGQWAGHSGGVTLTPT